MSRSVSGIGENSPVTSVGRIRFRFSEAASFRHPTPARRDEGCRLTCFALSVRRHLDRYDSNQLPQLAFPVTSRVLHAAISCCEPRYLEEGFSVSVSHPKLLRVTGFSSTCFNIHSYLVGRVALPGASKLRGALRNETGHDLAEGFQKR